MELKEFMQKFLPDYEAGRKEFERTNSMDEFEEWLIDNFSVALQNFTDMICEEQRVMSTSALCCICKKNYVDSSAGYDTCNSCLAKL
jgi:hypothetical protein